MKTFRLNIKDEFEAEIFTNILEEEQIPFVIISNRSSVYDGIFEFALGWGFLEIPEEFKEKALTLYDEYKKSTPNFEE